MVYTIGFGKRNSPDVLNVIERNTAKEALELAEALERKDEEIRFIDTPTDGRVETARVDCGHQSENFRIPSGRQSAQSCPCNGCLSAEYSLNGVKSSEWLWLSTAPVR